MLTPGQYRAKAAEYGELAKSALSPEATRRFAELEQSFTTLADNEQWMNDNYGQTVHWPKDGNEKADTTPLAPLTTEIEDEDILLCLGAALILQWETLPRKMQRELLDRAGSIGELLDTPALRGQIAHFLSKNKHDKK